MKDESRRLIEHAKLIQSMKDKDWGYEKDLYCQTFQKNIGGLDIRIYQIDGRSDWTLSAPGLDDQRFAALEEAFQIAEEFEEGYG